MKRRIWIDTDTASDDVVAIIIALIGGTLVYGALKAFVGIRLDQEEEYNGADLSIHKIGATPEREPAW